MAHRWIDDRNECIKTENMRQIDVIGNVLQKLEMGGANEDQQASSFKKISGHFNLLWNNELNIYFRELSSLTSAEDTIHGFLQFWDADEIVNYADKHPALQLETGTGYLRFADFEFCFIIYVLCVDQGRFTGVGTTISTIESSLVKKTSSLRDFLSLIVSPDYEFHEPLS